MNITVLSQVQQQEPLHHLQEVQQPVIMLCQQPAKELSFSKAHTLWGSPRNHQRDLRGILQGTLIMITWTPVETLGMMFHMVAAASDPGAKLSVMEQVGALLKRCTFFDPEYHDHVVWHHTFISHFTTQVLSHFKWISCLHSQGSVCSLYPLNHWVPLIQQCSITFHKTGIVNYTIKNSQNSYIPSS